MEWWQITLILLGASIVGILGGFSIYYIVRRIKFNPSRFLGRSAGWRSIGKRPAASMTEKPGRGLMPVTGELKGDKIKSEALGKEGAEVVRMVPLFSRRSIIVLVIGFAVGLCLGLGYWALSPIQVGFSGSWPLIRIAGLTEPRPVVYESKVSVGVTGWWARPSERERLESFGEVSAMTLSSSGFLEHLSQELERVNAQYQRSPEEIQRMISASYRYAEHYVRVLVTSHDRGESVALADLITSDFVPYMDEQVDELYYDRYVTIVGKMDNVSVELVRVENELNAITSTPDSTDTDPSLDPEYVLLQARADVLYDRLLELALTQVSLDNPSPRTTFDITAQMEDISHELVETRAKLAAFSQGGSTEAFALDPDYLTLTAEKSALESQRKNLINSLIASNNQYLEEKDLLGSLTLGDTFTTVPLPPERVQGRYAAVLGALLGLAVAWLMLNFRALVQQIRSSPLVSGVEQYSGNEEEE